MQSISLPVINKRFLKKALLNYHYFSDSAEHADKKLIEKALNGDDQAFKQLINKHLKSVYNFLYQLTKDTSSLDDLTQETFIKVWKNLSRFDQSKSFKVWIFTIARNTAYDYLKKRKAIPFSSFDKEEINKLEEIDETPLPDEILERQDLEREIEAKLSQIPEHYRIVLILHYKHDFSLSEIAQILKEPYNTIKSRHQRGMQKLKALLVVR